MLFKYVFIIVKGVTENTLAGTINASARQPNLWLPIDIDSDSAAVKLAGSGQPSLVLNTFRSGFTELLQTSNGFGTSSTLLGERLYKHHMPIIFDRFNNILFR